MAVDSTIACSAGGTFTIVGTTVTGSTSNCAGEITIPADVTQFSDATFRSRAVTSVVFEPNSNLVTLNREVFKWTLITSIDLPDKLATIGFEALAGTKLTSLSIPGSVTEFGFASLSGMRDLETVVFETRTTSAPLSHEARNFAGSRKLASITWMGPRQFNSIPQSPAREAHDFVGLSLTPGGPIVSFPLTANDGITLYTIYTPKTFIATFRVNGGSVLPPKNIIGGQFEGGIPVSVRPGYEFLGWCDAGGGGECPVTGWWEERDISFAPEWAAKTFALKFDSNGGSAVPDSSWKFDTALAQKPTNPTRPGYNFVNWFEANGAGVEWPYGRFIVQDTTLVAKWAPKSHAVNFDSKGGGSKTPESFFTGGDISVSPSAPYRNGYTLAGWSATDNGPMLSFPYTPGVIEPITLFAVWTPNTYAVDYRSNGGSAVSPGSFVTGGAIASPPAEPIRPGFGFEGWTNVYDGPAVSFPYSPASIGDITLWARWVRLYEVNYVSSGGSAVEVGYFKALGNVSSAPASPTRPGYTFAGWSRTNGGDTISFPYAPGVSDNINLYAKWTANLNSVFFNSNRGTSVADGSFFTDSTVMQAPDAPTRLGYTFDHWSAAESGSAILFPYFSGATSDITLFANWTANTYLVNHDTKNGAPVVVAAGSYQTDSEIVSAPATPVRAGYTLLGWSATDGGSAVSFPYAPGVIGDITLYAVWDANTHSVNLILNGGSTVPAVSFKTDAAITSAPATPIRSGHTFNGWSATDGGSLITFPYAPGVIESITLYSDWTRNPYKPELLANATVSGTGFQSTNMKATFGSWSAYPDAVLSVQWYRCDKAVSAGLSSIAASAKCVVIPKATKTTYKVVVADELKYLTVLVQAKNTIGTSFTTAKSFRALALKAPTKGKLPDLDGSAIAKKPLTADIGTWTSNPIAKTSVQWFRCEEPTKLSSLPVSESSECTAIKGATKLKYTLSKADEGKYVTAQVKAENTEGIAFTTAKSSRVALTPSSVNAPAISGSAQLNKTLTAGAGSWEAYPAAKTSFKWYRCNKPTTAGAKMFGGSSGCAAIKGATKNRYTVTASDRGKYISALVTAENEAGKATVTAESEQVAFAPSKTANPGISGSPAVDKTLTASPGRWSAFPEVSTSFAWYRCSSPAVAGAEKFAGASGCVPIGGANQNSYTVKEADQGKYIAVLVKVRNSAGSSSATSKSTAKVG
jgi:uncharacterized repeat protein (TIGR02543 family)